MLSDSLRTFRLPLRKLRHVEIVRHAVIHFSQMKSLELTPSTV